MAFDYWEWERQDFLDRAAEELAGVLGDGSKKRQAGEKPPWWKDSHEAQIFSHLNKWKKGELVDPDSGRHPLVHGACRMLMIAMSENDNNPGAELEREVAGYEQDVEALGPGLAPPVYDDTYYAEGQDWAEDLDTADYFSKEENPYSTAYEAWREQAGSRPHEEPDAYSDAIAEELAQARVDYLGEEPDPNTGEKFFCDHERCGPQDGVRDLGEDLSYAEATARAAHKAQREQFRHRYRRTDKMADEERLDAFLRRDLGEGNGRGAE